MSSGSRMPRLNLMGAKGIIFEFDCIETVLYKLCTAMLPSVIRTNHIAFYMHCSRPCTCECDVREQAARLGIHRCQ